jgi:hypothetical protein
MCVLILGQTCQGGVEVGHGDGGEGRRRQEVLVSVGFLQRKRSGGGWRGRAKLGFQEVLLLLIRGRGGPEDGEVEATWSYRSTIARYGVFLLRVKVLTKGRLTPSV